MIWNASYTMFNQVKLSVELIIGIFECLLILFGALQYVKVSVRRHNSQK